jgi:hypothetical protein
MATNRKVQAQLEEAEETLQSVAELVEEADDAALTREELIEKIREIGELVEEEESEVPAAGE